MLLPTLKSAQKPSKEKPPDGRWAVHLKKAPQNVRKKNESMETVQENNCNNPCFFIFRIITFYILMNCIGRNQKSITGI